MTESIIISFPLKYNYHFSIYKHNFPHIICFEGLLPFLQLFFGINLSSIYFPVNHSNDTDFIRFNTFHNVKSCEYFSLGIVLNLSIIFLSLELHFSKNTIWYADMIVFSLIYLFILFFTHFILFATPSIF